jgi:antitoxin Phd
MYTYWMSKAYSVAEARKNLPAVLDEVASGAEVHLTRRGRPVAVLVSVDEYSRLKAGRAAFADAYKEFRAEHPAGGISVSYFRKLRDRNQGRKISL